ncbi:MAG: DivIVA domain-containing protein [Thermoanaerobaculaceae bacterium]|nr:DivIVA domain-containing protein [Thermoanaerobaculaceae bacterium]MDI9473251.1 DivIVA domain-containing protein [Bacillota bacterium]MDI9620492.1 DivIVA domain-containing protein [Acidobacteriota bacterium]NLH12714.1 DivIVA domain-containing protein [Holophagae bacterium]HPW56262.1 DivIVA domain-containing protein [Thermoanaerobaculaceae bacterium]
MNRMTPLEIQRASFPLRWKGMDSDAVRALLSQLAEQVEEEARVRGELKAQVARLSGEVEEYRQRTNALNETLVAAQHTAEAIIGRAEAEAQRIVSEAQALADRVIDDAIHRAENLELIIGQLRSRRRAARAEVKKVIELLQGFIRDDEAAEEREVQVPSVALMRPRVREGQASS